MRDRKRSHGGLFEFIAFIKSSLCSVIALKHRVYILYRFLGSVGLLSFSCGSEIKVLMKITLPYVQLNALYF